MATASWVIERVTIGSFISYDSSCTESLSVTKFGVVAALHRSCWVVETLLPVQTVGNPEVSLEIQHVPCLQLQVGIFAHVFFGVERCDLILVAPEAYFHNHIIVYRIGMEKIYLMQSQVVRRRGISSVESVPLERFVGSSSSLIQPTTGPVPLLHSLLSVSLEVNHFPYLCYSFRNQLVSLIQNELRLSRGRRNALTFRTSVSVYIAGYLFDFLHTRGVAIQLERIDRLAATVVGINTIRRLYAPAHTLCASFSNSGLLVGLLGYGFGSYPLTPPHFTVGNVAGFGTVQIFDEQLHAIEFKYDVLSSSLSVRLKVHVVNVLV